MSDERRTYSATVTIDLEDVTEAIADEFWSSLRGHEIEVDLIEGSYTAEITDVRPDL